jgi:hypothetical protein
MFNPGEFVLPETLAVSILNGAESLAFRMHNNTQKLLQERDNLRKKLIDAELLKAAPIANLTVPDIYAVDGGCGAESDVSNTYLVSLAIRVGPDPSKNVASSLQDVMPHSTDAEGINSGLMSMQEIKLAHEVATSNQGWCLIDGSRISQTIQMYQLYGAINPEKHTNRLIESPAIANAIEEFEKNPNAFLFLTNPNIIGITKMVSTREIYHRLSQTTDLPDWLATLDDKAISALVLQTGEFIGPLFLTLPLAIPSNMAGYPHAPAVATLIREIHEDHHPCQLAYFYFKPRPDVTLKIEVNRTFLLQNPGIDNLLYALRRDLAATEFLEPYQLWLADHICKEAVSLSFQSIKELILRQRNYNNWSINQPYRTPNQQK